MNPIVCYFDSLSVMEIKGNEEAVRVRQIISKMKYESLIKRKLIPDLEVFYQRLSKPKYPDFVVKTKAYPVFGMLLEYVLRKYFSLIHGITIDFGFTPQELTNRTVNIFVNSNVKRDFIMAANILASSDLSSKPLRESDIDSSLNWIDQTCMNMVNKWTREYGTKLFYRVELSNRNLPKRREVTVVGHPDIVTNTTIWDVKCGCTEKTQRRETYLQILAYWALCDDPLIKTIGVIFPMSNAYVNYDMSGWNKALFLHELCSVAKSMMIQYSLANYASLIQQQDILIKYPVGRHVGNIGVYGAVQNWIQACVEIYGKIRPMQIYLRQSRDSSQSKKTVAEIPQIAELVRNYRVPFYTHGILAMNLCLTDDYIHKVIIKDLEQTRAIGGKGVVVHLGKSKDLSLEQAFTNQTANIRLCLPYATPQCRILLETPSCMESEICSSLDSLNTYLFNTFSQAERNLIGICLDTCHVFVAGASPLEYIQYWMQNGCVGIGLVHFNDSINYFGYCVDRHEYPGRGKIGFEEMSKIAEFCVAHGIDMVYE